LIRIRLPSARRRGADLGIARRASQMAGEPSAVPAVELGEGIRVTARQELAIGGPAGRQRRRAVPVSRH
jgi:hypothetical protein